MSRLGTDMRGFLGKLLRDRGGNTLAIIAAATLPLVGIIGGGIDISRLYLVKARLQHACDAGALSGRKVMAGSSWTTEAEASADQLFSANFADGAYGTSNLDGEFTEDDGVVTGTASVDVPMTLMRVFGFSESTVEVDCTAKMEIPNTDVMFVLDTTGSMNCAPSDPNVFCNQSVPAADKRITALRIAVKCFYETLARIDTDATEEECGSTPTGGAGTAQIRFGFVPYATNVNVGKLLPNEYMVDSWTYQTRRANLAVPPEKTETRWESYGGGSLTKANCLKFMNNEAFSGFTPTELDEGGPAPAPTIVVANFATTNDGTATDGGANGEWGWSRGSNSVESWGNAPDRSTGGSDNKKSCRRKKKTTTTYYEEKFQDWTYNQFEVDVSGLKNGGSTWNSSFTIPGSATDPDTQSVANATAGSDVPDTTISWDGCIEERQTVETDDFDPIPDEAFDLDIDLIPDSDATRWKPALPRLIYTRRGNSTYYWDTASITTATNYPNGSSYACPIQASKLAVWSNGGTTAGGFSKYVNSLSPNGATYHDIGLLWGARLMSPTGIFADENEETPTGGTIQRHMIFMTDGDTNANSDDYAAYGLPWFDRRQTADRPSKSDMDDQVNARFSALCTAVKNKNITLWVISFGAGVNEDTQGRLKACSSNGNGPEGKLFFPVADSEDLISRFKQIASEIADLRLTS